ncbi:hypothetical protein BC831DRAFT_440042 [Entophlyctis helioformis]|nr:hypothetical protein BC831DRAFT_440042 [Entophlyctis helioformis]
MGLMNMFSLDYQLVKYGKFHHNTINKIIHLIFVPTIMFTAMVWLTAIEGPAWKYDHILPANAALILGLAFASYYFILWPLVGLMAFPLIIDMCYLSNIFAAQDDWAIKPAYAALLIHIVSWAFQIFGHYVFEGRSPAFVQDPVQAIVLAPFFVYIEFLFAIGLFPGTRKRIEGKIVAAIKKLDAKNE